MKVIIAGTRYLDLYIHQFRKLWTDDMLNLDISEVVCGDAPGVDTLGRIWAESEDILVVKFPADWHTYGKKAGILRNQEMGHYADALVAFPSKSKSKGTYHMIKFMSALGKPVYIEELP